jgi:exonuclease VII large subunit
VTTQDPITLEELTKRPARYFEQRVNVNGTVGRTLSPNSFSLTSPNVADEATEVQSALVAGDRGSVPDLSEGQRVRVVGEARKYDPSEIQQELGINLDNNLHAPFEERPVIILGNVEVVPGGGTTAR